MNFKIDTKASFTAIQPIYDVIDATLAEALTDKCTELADNGSQNFLINLNNCQIATSDGLELLTELHDQCYEQEQSLVFTGLQPAVAKALKAADLDLAFNIAPTEKEAVDIISMEILERDLSKDDD